MCVCVPFIPPPHFNTLFSTPPPPPHTHTHTHTALGKMEELMLEMKQDTSRLPMELTKLPSVSAQLKLDELSTLGRMAGKAVSSLAVAPSGGASSVITESPSGPSRGHSSTTKEQQVVAKQQQQQQQQHHQVVLLQEPTGGGAVTDAQFQLTYASGQSALVYPATSSSAAVQLAMAAQPGLAVTPEGVIVYSVAPGGGAGTQYSTIQQSNSTADTTVTSSQAAYAAAISVPSYVDGNLYLAGQTLQLMPVSGYWPTDGGTPAAVAMVQQGSQTILQPVQYGISAGSSSSSPSLSTDTANSSKTGKRGIITID